jgi:putative transposase
MTQGSREQIASFRYSLIAPVVSRQTPLTPGELGAFLREVSQREYDIPGSTSRRVSMRTLERYLALYRKGSYEALMPKVRNDKRNMRLSETVLWRAVELRCERPERSVEQIILLLEAEGVAEAGTVAVSTLARHLRQAGLSRRELLITPQNKGTFRRFEAEDVHVLWQADFQHTLYIPDPDNPGKRKKAILFAILDDYSRLIVHGQFYWDEKMPRMEDSLKKAILRHGVPEQLYVDNGAVFASDHLKRICGRVGIHLSHSTVRRPAGRGKIERLFRFIDTSFVPEAYQAIDSGYIETLEDLNDAFQTWVNGYYHERKHGSTGTSPKQRAAQTARKPRRVSEQELTEIFYWQEERKADKAGCVSLQGNLFQVEDELANKKIQLRYDPYDLTTIQVWHDEKRYADATPVDLTRRYDRRVQQDAETKTQTSNGISMFEALRKKQRANAEGLSFAEGGDLP